LVNILKQNINWQTTDYNYPFANKINKVITANLRIVCKEIVRNIPRLTSIYLTGSYSRGEGCVIINNNKIKILSDFDIFIISDAQPFILKIQTKALQKALSQLKLLNTYIMPGHPIVELYIVNKKRTQNLLFETTPLFNYELRTAKLIYGKEMLNTIPKIESNYISPYNGMRLLFDRIFGAIIPFSTDLLYFKPECQKQRHLMFEVTKLILACRDSLLLLDGIYFPTSKQRQIYFENKYKRYNFLVQSSYFLYLTNVAQLYRLRPSKELEKDAIKLSFLAFNLSYKILTIFLEKIYKIRDKSWRSILNSLMNIEFQPFIYETTCYILKNLKKEKYVFNYLFNKSTNRILSAMIILILAVSENGIDKLKLNKALEILYPYMSSLNIKHNEYKMWNFLKEVIVCNYISPFPPTISIRKNWQFFLAEVLLSSKYLMKV